MRLECPVFCFVVFGANISVLKISYYSLVLCLIWLITSAKKQATVIASVPRGASGMTRMLGGISLGGNSSGADACGVGGADRANIAIATRMITTITAIGTIR
jgi:hypothetical protein